MEKQALTRTGRILPIIVLSQFLCTSLWFAGNAVMGSLANDFQLAATALGHITSAVLLGFITGTLVYAVFNIADRFSPSRVFLLSAIAGALFNMGIILEGMDLTKILFFRFLTGFFIAGVYPVGMKIAADYYQQGLGKSLGFLVGALVLGTAFPHLLTGFTETLPWRFVLVFTSGLAVLGGLLIAVLVPNGPYRTPRTRLELAVLFTVFKQRDFRAAAFGYFGHMWELFAFWAFVPVILTTYGMYYPETDLNVSLLSFLIIGVGGIACVFAGYVSQKLGVKKTATIALCSSFICCMLSPLLFYMPPVFLIGFMVFWGLVVIADSPMFSTLVAHHTTPESKGTALTIVNFIGFAITIVSVELINGLQTLMKPEFIYTLLAIGPALGLLALWKKAKK